MYCVREIFTGSKAINHWRKILRVGLEGTTEVGRERK